MKTKVLRREVKTELASLNGSGSLFQSMVAFTEKKFEISLEIIHILDKEWVHTWI